MTVAGVIGAEAEIEKLILREARLLDQWDLNTWLTLYTEDAIYWVPIDESADPLGAPSIMYDDARVRAVRVEQLLNQRRLAQTPFSRIVRFISNIEVLNVADDLAQARYNLLVTELRPGDWRQNGVGEKLFHIGTVDLRLRKEAQGWRFLHKTILLLDRDQPIELLSFIL